MAINNGDFVRLNFTGKLRNDEIFDTTFEDVAKEADLLMKTKNTNLFQLL